ncbi:hypothetical protein [Kitasatospora sp. GAS204B]|uniref:hypothetical protein n=1 Tax=unclassified Kitasatospora TaxID=2633591 RepID=UPI002475939A|nr:hypothetical protein [Kitasatospora sp. GAS204B]MDH6122638.1 hypothetical protein [Kitasatospora sp. GAS204B]
MKLKFAIMAVFSALSLAVVLAAQPSSAVTVSATTSPVVAATASAPVLPNDLTWP